MKAIKAYFCFFSRHPILFNLLLLCLYYIPIPFIVLEEQLTLSHYYLSPYTFLIVHVVFIFHVVLIYSVADEYITRDKSDFGGFENYDNEWFRVLILEGGKKVILTKPLWGKGEVYVVSDPTIRIYYSRKDSELEYTFSIQGKYKNSCLTFPVTIKLKFSNDFDKMEVFNVLLSHYQKNKDESKYLSLESYVRDVFYRFNNPFKDKFNELVELFSKKEISEPVLMDGLIEMLIFPEGLFSNIEDVQLCLGEPKISSCKGITCES